MKRYSFDAVVLGSGAAGFNAAIRIKEGIKKSVAIVTEGVNMGTSRNTGSDKQTYYKLGLGGDAPDSVRKMASDLFSCGAVDGDNALCEAALSARCFYNLTELGVPFPHNRYGEFVGYKTDHDPYARATSAGPLTSKFMTEALEKRAAKLEIPVFDGFLGLEALKGENGICGIICLEKVSGEMIFFETPNIVLATGGPAGIYADSVYPECHTGASSIAIEAGAVMQNLTEWQYGLASVSPRWNVSGTYMQVLPRFVSVDENGCEHEFLSDFFDDPYEAMSNVFMKGYQWPFDGKKVLSGSSVIDLLVYTETALKGRRVYLDYTKNPFELEKIEFEKLSAECRDYLVLADACFGTPIERLLKMNAPAIELYRSKGVDISKEMLQIALCAQHSNGGVSVDLWWQSSVPGLFAAGECAGTHGITRPGGSALNSGQVGSLRAAMYICSSDRKVDHAEFLAEAEKAEQKHAAFCKKVLANNENAKCGIDKAAKRMSALGSAIRVPESLKKALCATENELLHIDEICGVSSENELYLAYKLKDILVTQAAVLKAMSDYAENVGVSRGSALIFSDSGDLREGLDGHFRLKTNGDIRVDKIQEIKKVGDGFSVSWRAVRPIPSGDDFFENVWRGYRENKNVY